jgi:hypothetical protein
MLGAEVAACPCGCNARVSFRRRGAAAQYLTVTETFVWLREFDYQVRDVGFPDEINSLPEFIRRGEMIAFYLLEHLHGQARAGVHPDLLELGREIDAWNRSLERFMVGFLAVYGAPAARLGTTHGRR